MTSLDRPDSRSADRPDAVLALGPSLDTVPRARHVVRESLVGLSPDAIHDAELIATELVTNAVLHGAAPAWLHVRRGPDRVRIEVRDSGTDLPILPRANAEAMTGRGLSLIAALAGSWGVDSAEDGTKVVWAELSPDRDTSARDAVPATGLAGIADWPRVALVGPQHTVRLGAVPTSLLLAAKSHIDNVIRESTLARAGDAHGDLPPELAALFETVAHTFATARREIRRQALAAYQRGDTHTELVLVLPPTAADAGETYLAALDQIDRYARAARLLTLEAPPVHRVFRRWYVQSIVDQLRAQVAGGPVPSAKAFADVLADEVTALATLRESADRLQLLQRVAGELNSARTVEEIAAVVTAAAVHYLGALTARVALLGEDKVLRSLGAFGGDAAWAARFPQMSLDEDLPGPEVVRTGRAITLRGLDQILGRYPALAGVFPTDRTLHLAPLVVGGEPVGAFALTFPLMTDLDATAQESFVASISGVLAQSLQRAQMMLRAAEANDRLSAANERLSFLAEASVALSGSLDYQATIDTVARLLVPRLGDWCVLRLVEDGVLRTVAVRHRDPERQADADRLARRPGMHLDTEFGGAFLVRSGRPVLVEDVGDHLIEQVTTDPAMQGVIRQLGARSTLWVPLAGRDSVLGTLSLVHAESGRRFGPDDVPIIEELARRAALALEMASRFREQTGRLANITRIAEAAQQAILATPPARIGPVALAARYVSAAAEAQVGGDLYEVVARPGAVRLLIGDVRGKGLTAVRTATVVLGEFRGAAEDLDSLTDVVDQLDRRLRSHLGAEDFVTALVAEIADDGSFTLVSRGHPPALLASPGRGVTAVAMEHGPPLGIDGTAAPARGRLEIGDRLLLYTDGMIEARTPARDFVDLAGLTVALPDAPLDAALDQTLDALHAAAGPHLGDDLALLLAEFRP